MSGRLRMRQRNVFMVTIVFSLSINRSAINNGLNKPGARVRRPGKSADLSSCIFSLQLLRLFVSLWLGFTWVKKSYLVSPLFDFYWTVGNLRKNYHISMELAFYRMTWVLYDIVCVSDCCAIWQIFSIVVFLHFHWPTMWYECFQNVENISTWKEDNDLKKIGSHWSKSFINCQGYPSSR